MAQGLTERMVELDTEFHDILCQSSGSKRIYEMCQTFREYMLKFRTECLRDPAIARRAVAGHERIYRAICDRDETVVGTCVDRHLREVMEDVIGHYRRMARSSAESKEQSLSRGSRDG